jgi:hypothetical protein
MNAVIRHAMLLGAALCLAAAPAAGARLSSLGAAAAYASSGRVDVHLARLLADAPDSERAPLGKVYDVKLRLLHGYVVLLRKGGDFAALLPIERVAGAADSLRYFYYVEHARVFWLFPGSRERGIKTVPAGGALEFNTFRLLWRPQGPGVGWLYFPDDAATRRLRFSVVSGQTIDEADPRDTKYWIELGPATEPGF